MSPPPQVLDLRAFRADRPGLGCRFSVVPPGYPQGVSTPIIDRRSPCPTQPHARGPAATPAAQWGFAVSGFEGVLVPYAALPQHGAVPYATRWGRVARSRCVLGIVSAKHAPCGGTGGPLGSRCKAVDPVLVGEQHDAARRVEERHGAPGAILDVDARRCWQVVWVAGRRVWVPP